MYARAPQYWLFSRTGGLLYLLGWANFACGFAALFWFREGASFGAAFRDVLRVMLPAGLLGIVAVWSCTRWDPVRSRSVTMAAVHLAACAFYPALWIASVSGSRSVQLWWSSGKWVWFRPPEHVLHWHALTGVLIYAVLAAVTWGFQHALRAERERLLAESRALRAQLNPHFLFNTLHSLFALAQVHPSAGDHGLERFSRLLAYTLRVQREGVESVSFEEEWNFTRDYLELEAIRLGERLRWRTEIDDDAWESRIPPLVCQPLVENAVRHGIESRAAGGTIVVRASAGNDGISVVVADDGPGCATPVAREGIGLRSVRARLRALPQGAGSLTIETAPGRGFAAHLLIPDSADGREPVALRRAAGSVA